MSGQYKIITSTITTTNFNFYEAKFSQRIRQLFHILKNRL